ncbi:MAG: YqgE/AlgH family protein [Phycisphaeraceae bacterium]|nr:YqgE/AlgH family protein [Phycisphaeraceae bacterium]
MQSLQGCLLVAGPNLLDPNFFHTLVLLVQHGEEGALGLIINRPTQAKLTEVWNQVSEGPCGMEAVLHQGGPCEGPLMVLHEEPELSQVTVIPSSGVSPGLHFCTDEEKIRWLVERASMPSRFFVGYAGWTAGQLEQELDSGSWLLAPATSEVVFASDDQTWSLVLRQVTVLSEYPHLNPKWIPADPTVN